MGNIAVFVGGFGSGKSEIAINFAIEKAIENSNVVLADLDLVNPFFVSRDVHAVLKKTGIRLIAPVGELSFGDVPHLPAEIISIIKQDNEMFIDLGGDEGSLVMGYLRDFMKLREKVDLYMVLNPYRPFASDFNAVSDLQKLLETATRTKITGIISNPNLVEESSLESIIEGHMKVETFAEHLGVAVKYLTVEARFYDQLIPQYGNILKKLKLYLRPDWLRDC